jgi:hypothetical protein
LTAEDRLAFVVSTLESLGVSCLVMGGHAVRFYGFARNTDDFDLHIAPNLWDDLTRRLAGSALFPSGAPVEGDSWRPDAFRRFRLGALADGRDEWLEFWGENHLLLPYSELTDRAERGLYGGRFLDFLGLPDLIRSKETERDRDWRDIAVLEQILDARSLARFEAGQLPLDEVLINLRSRAGFESVVQRQILGNTAVVAAALGKSPSPITQAFLIPFAPDAPRCDPICPLESILVERLRKTAPASSLHVSIVEIIRRRYVQFRKELDRRNKEEIRTDREQR